MNLLLLRLMFCTVDGRKAVAKRSRVECKCRAQERAVARRETFATAQGLPSGACRVHWQQVSHLSGRVFLVTGMQPASDS